MLQRGSKYRLPVAMRPIPFESTVTLSQLEFSEWIEGRLGNDSNRYELLNGRILMNPPAAWPHGAIGNNLQVLLGSYVKRKKLGLVFDSSQGFELPSGDTLEPDHSFVSQARWSAAKPPVDGKFLTVVPDLVVEVLSLSTALIDRGEKKAIYEHNGVSEYWLVDHHRREVTVFKLKGKKYDRGQVHAAGGRFKSAAVKGLTVRVDDVF